MSLLKRCPHWCVLREEFHCTLVLHSDSYIRCTYLSFAENSLVLRLLLLGMRLCSAQECVAALESRVVWERCTVESCAIYWLSTRHAVMTEIPACIIQSLKFQNAVGSSNLDTNGQNKVPIINEVSLFQEYITFQNCSRGEKRSFLERCPHFRGILRERLHCMG